MSDVTDMIEEVEQSEVFKGSENSYLVHFFCQAKDDNESIEIGYYDKGSDTITSFTLQPLTKKPPEEIFKESGLLEELDISKVKKGLLEARRIAREFAQENYQGHPVSQEICILQQSGVPLWNITLVTSTLNLLNLKIDAASGEVVNEDMQNILSLRKQ